MALSLIVSKASLLLRPAAAFALALALICSSSDDKARAAEPTATAQAIAVSLDEAYKMAMASHESIKIASEIVDQSDSNVTKALSSALPKIYAEGAYTAFSEQKNSGALVLQPESAKRFDLRLVQPVYTGGREWAARRAAKIAYDKTNAYFNASRENLVRAVARAYYNQLKAEKDLEIKQAALKRAEERSKVAAARFKVGEVTKSAVLRADALVAGAEAELIKAHNDLQSAKDILKRMLGADREIKVLEPTKRDDMQASKPEELLNSAYLYRLDYKQSLLDEQVADEGVSYAWSGFLPSLRLEGTYSWRDQSPVSTFMVKDSVSGSVILSYPIFEGALRYAEVSEARSKRRESELRRIGLKRDIAIQLRDAINRVEAVRAVITSYRKQLALAEEDYNMVFEQFKFGLATTVDVIDADATLISAQRSLMNSTYDLELSKLELKFAAGTLLDEIDGARGAKK